MNRDISRFKHALNSLYVQYQPFINDSIFFYTFPHKIPLNVIQPFYIIKDYIYDFIRFLIFSSTFIHSIHCLTTSKYKNRKEYKIFCNQLSHFIQQFITIFDNFANNWVMHQNTKLIFILENIIFASFLANQIKLQD